LMFSVRIFLSFCPLGPLRVMRGLYPRIHPLRKKLDCRVKPGNDAWGRLQLQ
jgi:hypothetical protein